MTRQNPKDWRMMATIAIDPDPRAGRAFVGWSVDWVAAGLAHQINRRASIAARAITNAPGVLDDPDADPARWAECLWPIVVRSASSAMWVDRGLEYEVTSRRPIGDGVLERGRTDVREPLAEEFTGFFGVDNGPESDVMYARGLSWHRVRPGVQTDWLPDPITWDLEWRVTTWDTQVNETEFRRLSWPSADQWPEQAAYWLEDVQPRPAEVAALLNTLTQGRVRTQPPYVAAKWVAGEVARRFVLKGDSIEPVFRRDRSGRFVVVERSFEGIDLREPAEVAHALEGTFFDLPLLVRDVYREMGLPARVVFGLATGGFDGRTAPISLPDEARSGLYAWVEVALLDTRQQPPEVIWIPVDPLRLKDRGEPARGIDAPWDGFGNALHLSDVVPLSFHVHPPLQGAVSFALLGEEQAIGVNGVQLRVLPALWGMRSNVNVGLMRQVIALSATSVASNDRHGRPEWNE